MLAQLSDLRFCALMSGPLCPTPLYPVLFCLRPYVVDRKEKYQVHGSKCLTL